eukprot:TRINITY_DN80109_c0_g1_i1.p1 TRINITY_DN80109_c0_g1~~TRINITY_DN80109_c0_g1_i1.p1  ORF type:complete len:432 (+),score=115.41 TRINITY_DN80109_c0_g1_i1:29-1297(+)
MPKASRKRAKNVHNPLASDIASDRMALPKRKRRARENAEKENEDVEEISEILLPEKISRRIFDEAQKQALDMEQDEHDEEGEEGEEIELEYDDAATEKSQFTDDQSEAGLELDPEEEEALRMFLPESMLQTRNLADIIMSKIKDKERGGDDEEDVQSVKSEGGIENLDPQVVQVYRQVGQLLATYKSGRLPKAIKIIPMLKNWEDLLLLTQPETWTPNAAYEVTRVFSSALNATMCQRFLNGVLLPSIREWLKENKKLNPHYWMAMKKALRCKPQAFFKGFVLPLLDDGCGLQEALVVGSFLKQQKVPVLHGCVGLMKMASMPFTNGAATLFIRLLLQKQWSLPLKVIDGLVQHFARFLRVEGPLPVLWHQALLAFVAHYKANLTLEQAQVLRQVCDKHSHILVSSDIRRELAPLLMQAKKA